MMILYQEQYQIIKRQRKIASQETLPSIEKFKLQPNDMQTRFILNLRKILNTGEERALLISATGTGKTYASAFAMRELGFKRVLSIGGNWQDKQNAPMKEYLEMMYLWDWSVRDIRRTIKTMYSPLFKH